jgi:hypothetical protein
MIKVSKSLKYLKLLSISYNRFLQLSELEVITSLGQISKITPGIIWVSILEPL